jgi:hypothetical protein
MRIITELNVLLRARTALPSGLRITTEEFREGWSFMLAFNAQQLIDRVQSCGWNIIRIAEGLQACGVGDTSQEAIASGLRLALIRMSKRFNAVEVKYIELTKYPWFYLARVRVCPFRIHQDAVLPVPDEFLSSPILHRQRRLPHDADVLYPHFGSAMPQIRQMLTSSRTAEAGQQ